MSLKCSRCKTPVPDDASVVVICTARQTHSSPAEYDELPICDACAQYEAYISDPFNESYERARAGGWSD